MTTDLFLACIGLLILALQIHAHPRLQHMRRRRAELEKTRRREVLEHGFTELEAREHMHRWDLENRDWTRRGAWKRYDADAEARQAQSRNILLQRLIAKRDGTEAAE